MAIPNLSLRGFERDSFEAVGKGPYPLPHAAAKDRQTGLTDTNLVASPNSPAWDRAAADHQKYLDAQMIELGGFAVPREDLL